MRGLLFLAIVISLSLHADPTGTTLTSTSCTLGTQAQTNPSACDLTMVIGQAEYEVAAHASASANGMPWTIAFDTSPLSPFQQPPIAWSANSMAEDEGTFSTPGKSRTGLVEFDIQLFSSHDDFGLGASISDGTHNYGFTAIGSGPVAPTRCSIGTCEFQGELPLLLGSGQSFTVTLGGSAAAGNCQVEPGCTPGGNATMTFGLFESNGTTPIPFSPVAAVPEPTSCALACLGLLAAYFPARRFRSLRRS